MSVRKGLLGALIVGLAAAQPADWNQIGRALVVPDVLLEVFLEVHHGERRRRPETSTGPVPQHEPGLPRATRSDRSASGTGQRTWKLY